MVHHSQESFQSSNTFCFKRTEKLPQEDSMQWELSDLERKPESQNLRIGRAPPSPTPALGCLPPAQAAQGPPKALSPLGMGHPQLWAAALEADTSCYSTYVGCFSHTCSTRESSICSQRNLPIFLLISAVSKKINECNSSPAAH